MHIYLPQNGIKTDRARLFRSYMHIEFRVLGELRAYVDGREANLGPARQQCVLAALLVDANHTVSLNQLADRVWGQDLPQRLGGTLRSYLSRLRTALPATAGWAIEHRPGGYVAHVEDMTVDLNRFRKHLGHARAAADDEDRLLFYQEALGLWRGEAFANLDSAWLDSIRNALQAERFAALLDYHDVQLRRGEHTPLLPDLAILTMEHPLDERLAGQMILALYRSGRQADALKHYEGIRRELADELGVDPSPRLQQLHQEMLAGDLMMTSPSSERTNIRQLSSGRRPQPQNTQLNAISAVVPRQLPASIRRFIGRGPELRELNNLLEVSRHAVAEATEVIVVTGSAGVGKTSLVVHWAQTIYDEFRDGQIYLDLQGFERSDPTLGLSEAVYGLLEALGAPPWLIPSQLNARIGLYRTLLATKQMLVVLDNADNSELVRPLLPGASRSLTVVISRNRLTDLVAATDAHALFLKSFTRGESLEMLTWRLGADRVAAEPDAAAEIVGWCAGLPQALADVTARALAYPDLRLDELATQLYDVTRCLGVS